jgi:hypothetical protein
MRVSTVAILTLLSVIALGVGGFFYTRARQTDAPPDIATKPLKSAPVTATPSAPAKPSAIRFSDVTKQSGLDFVSFSGTTSEKHFPTANGTGVAMIDFDNDGWLDIYLPNSCRLDGEGPAPPNTLWRSRNGQSFELVPELTGADVAGFTQGVTVADFDNDGFSDLYLIRYGPNILLLNNGDGTFRDGTDLAGVGDPRWGTSAACLDYDEDGSLDMYVANYGKWDMDWHRSKWCGQNQPPVRIYCSPKLLPPEVHRLYHSHGNGVFDDVAESLGIARPDTPDRPGGRGQGVVTADLNGDGHIDIYVANDLCPNFLFVNTGFGAFEDHSESSCAAFNSEGQAQAGMGVDAGDVDENGLPELFVTNFYLEHNTLYRNLGKNLFNDASHWSGVAAGSIHAVGWGTAIEDFDNDGWPDILVVNGHVDDNLSQIGRSEPYAQLPGLWRNVGAGRFEKMQSEIGPYFESAHVARGAAFGDLDNDGAIDVVVSHKDEPATILRNTSRTLDANAQHAWIQLQLTGVLSNRDAIGAAIECHVGSRTIHRQIRGGRSYLSAHDMRVTIGLGDAQGVDRIVIRWPCGGTQELANPEIRKLHVVREAH